jgi:hypothetical protein
VRPPYGFAKHLPYGAACEKMGFDELREFIEGSLREPPRFGEGPRTREALLTLLEMLAYKGGVEWTRRDRDRVLEPKARRRYRELLAEQEQARRLLAAAERNMPADARARSETTKRAKKERRRQRRRLKTFRDQIARIEAEQEGGPEGPPTEPLTAKQRRALRQADRRRMIAEIYRDIERAFSEDGAAASPAATTTNATTDVRRLPWSVLPPGQLSLERVLAHYEKLGRVRPDVRYEPERIRKAYSLGPDGCYVGSDEFDGYVVFTFPRTNKALLERPVYGNAIYVLGPDWKRLSRLSKRELLADETHGVTKIVHKGDLFARTKVALGLG